MTLLARLVAASDAVGRTSKRTEKTALLADLLADVEETERSPAVAMLSGGARQGRIGVGWATVAAVDVVPAGEPQLTIGELDELFDRLAATTGPGSVERRHEMLAEVLGAATGAEADFVRRLIVGELRQGALESLVADAVAKAAGVKQASVRRALMLSGDLGTAAEIAFATGEAGLAEVGLTVGRPVLPMLASTAADVADAMADGALSSVEWKLDGIRVQVHKRGSEIGIYTRNLNDVTGRLPEVVALVSTFDADALVLDGEALGVTEGDDDAEVMFQDTASRFGRDDASTSDLAMAAWFFDILHHDSEDLIDRPLGDRLERLTAVVGDRRIPGRVTNDATVGQAVLDEALAAGHEGVMVKAVDSTYGAGRRGKAWKKVKPVRTLDLVVIAVEWGHGRRQGWLSNLHLGALGPDGTPVMVGKTFKGLTDELLAWQTEQFLAREVRRSGHVVYVRPEIVVEIALDGVQRSTRYPGGVALRFARVKHYRPDRDPAMADTIEAVQALLP